MLSKPSSMSVCTAHINADIFVIFTCGKMFTNMHASMSVSKCFIVNMIFTEIQFLVNQLAQNTQDFPDILLFQIL